MFDIESDDLAHPPFQEDLRESAGRGADVKDAPGDREAVGGEVSQRRVELARGPPDPDLAALDRQRRARRHPLRGATRGGLQRPARISSRRSRACPRDREPGGHERDVEACVRADHEVLN